MIERAPHMAIRIVHSLHDSDSQRLRALAPIVQRLPIFLVPICH
jgi:hypothetical protein